MNPQYKDQVGSLESCSSLAQSCLHFIFLLYLLYECPLHTDSNHWYVWNFAYYTCPDENIFHINSREHHSLQLACSKRYICVNETSKGSYPWSTDTVSITWSLIGSTDWVRKYYLSLDLDVLIFVSLEAKYSNFLLAKNLSNFLTPIENLTTYITIIFIAYQNLLTTLAINLCF